jgi:hypothetical protein
VGDSRRPPVIVDDPARTRTRTRKQRDGLEYEYEYRNAEYEYDRAAEIAMNMLEHRLESHG